MLALGEDTAVTTWAGEIAAAAAPAAEAEASTGAAAPDHDATTY